MAFLNRTNHGFPAALIYLWKALLPESLERETLIRRCAPESIDQKHVTNTLKKWTEFGFFCEDGDQVSLAHEADTNEAEFTPGLHALRARTRACALDDENNKDFGKIEPKRAEDFTMMLAWLLSSDVYGDHLKGNKAAAKHEEKQIQPYGDGKYVLQNDTRWPGFLDWAYFFEFGVPCNSGILLNPSRVVEAALPVVFEASDEKSQELPIEVFVDELSRQVPVLDGGRYAVKARERATENWPTLPEAGISPALSLALKTLGQRGAIELKQRDDAPSMHLLGRRFSRSSANEYTHILWGGDV